jgi:type III restriction enzyme
MRQSIQLLDHAVRAKMPDFAHAFQPLLRPLDDYALHILAKQLNSSVSAPMRESDYFEPYITGVSSRERNLLEKNARYLQQNLVYGRSIQKLGTLLFCLDYAQRRGPSAPGIWRDVQRQFGGRGMAALYADLREVNDFRNTRVAHIEQKLDDADEAWQAMIIWLRCIDTMGHYSQLRSCLNSRLTRQARDQTLDGADHRREACGVRLAKLGGRQHGGRTPYLFSDF